MKYEITNCDVELSRLYRNDTFLRVKTLHISVIRMKLHEKQDYNTIYLVVL